MLHEYLQLIPAEPGTGALVTAMIGTVVGAALWLLGVKFSRPLVTLFTVLAGATIGLQLPKWFGWQVSGSGPAVAGAVVLGVSGFVLHRMWIGIGLGAVIAMWATFVVWAVMHDGKPWSWPTYDGESTYWAYLQSAWATVPPPIARILPFACAASLVSGVAASILWPKLTTVLNWSTIGVSLLVGMGIAAMSFGAKGWIDHLPSQTAAQAAAVVAMVAIGAVIQWKLSPAVASSAARGGGKKSKDEPAG